jgi:hypothetical protein
VYTELGETAKARNALQKALTARPNFPEAAEALKAL